MKHKMLFLKKVNARLSMGASNMMEEALSMKMLTILSLIVFGRDRGRLP